MTSSYTPTGTSYGGSLTTTGKATLTSFFARGGDYVSIGLSGVDLSIKAGLLSVGYKNGSSNDNGILKVTYMHSDSVAAQYPANSYAFVYGPVWFTEYNGLKVSTYIQDNEFFVSGMWTKWKESGAAGKPVIVHGAKRSSIITLMGINPTFRAHPEHTFRLLANAIYNALG